MILQSQILALGQGLEIFPFLGLILTSAVVDFVSGLRKRSWVNMWLVCAGIAALGFWLVGPIGLVCGFLTPLLYYYARYS